ncbi:Ankyrin repeat protein [Giardia duodenalis]|uniref:Ankyrin repeat protein n=1 Tax=Giardia intestinalis TaxID=5741 RepID=V6TV78_GIAIN|nr:Ankyrin repeat protein [Giardia intestinalis]
MDIETTVFVNGWVRKEEMQACAKLTAEPILHFILTDFSLILWLISMTLSSLPTKSLCEPSDADFYRTEAAICIGPCTRSWPPALFAESMKNNITLEGAAAGHKRCGLDRSAELQPKIAE